MIKNKKKFLLLYFFLIIVFSFSLIYIFKNIYLYHNSSYYYKKIGKNKIFFSKKFSKNSYNFFIKNYAKIVNNFYNNKFLKNFDIRNEEIYILVFNNFPHDFNTSDKLLLIKLNDIKNKIKYVKGFLEDRKYFSNMPKYIDGFFVPNVKTIFINDTNIRDIFGILIDEVNHYLTRLRFIRYKGDNNDNELSFDPNYGYFYLIDDAITNLFGRIYYTTNTFNFNEKVVDYAINLLKKLFLLNPINLDYYMDGIKYLSYDYSNENRNLFNYEYIFLVYIYDNYGYEKIYDLIYNLYNFNFKDIDEVCVKIFNKKAKQLIEEAKHYYYKLLKFYNN